MTRFRCALHWLRAAAVFASGGLWAAKRQLRLSRSIIVLAFHRVLDDADLPRTNSLAGMVISRRTFEELTVHVAGRYEAVEIKRAVHEHGAPTIRVAFTFDDGWLDTYKVALPIAVAHGVPLTVFVCPGRMGTNAPFWPERAAALIKVFLPSIRDGEIERGVETLKHCESSHQQQAMAILDAAERIGLERSEVDSTVSWEQLADMAGAGVTIGSHTQTHQILTTVPESEAWSEICTSRASIERGLNRACPLFSYPNGNDSPHLRRLVAAAGYDLAFTMAQGAWRPASDPYAIPRLNVCEENVVGPNGRFSRLRFEYAVFWQAWRADQTGRPRNEGKSDVVHTSRTMARSTQTSQELSIRC